MEIRIVGEISSMYSNIRTYEFRKTDLLDFVNPVNTFCKAFVFSWGTLVCDLYFSV